MIAFLAFALPLSLYLSLPSFFWNFDGVACAAALELGQPAYFFHANHLLYGFLGFLFWKGLGLPLGLSRALPALQLFTSLLSCLGLIGLYRLLAAIAKNKWSALLLTVAMGATAAFWVWSVEAQVYPLGFLALAWAAFVLVETQGANKYLYVGLLHAGAVLGHLMHVLWIVPALYWLMDDCRRRHLSIRQALGLYAGALFGAVAIPYLLVLGIVIAPGRDLAHILIWLKGSVGLTSDRHWAWHWGGWSGPWMWLQSTLPVLWGSFRPYARTPVTFGLWIITALSALLVTALLLQAWRRRSDRLARFSVLWLVSYGLLLSLWEPRTLCYRLTDVLPWGILLALGLRAWKPFIQVSVVSLLLATFLTTNGITLLAPMHDAGQNAPYQDILTLSKFTPSDTLYITGGGIPWIYLLYFTGRNAWNAHSFRAADLMEGVARNKRTHPVFIQSELLRDPQLAPALSTIKLKQRSEGSSWLQVQ